MKYFGVCVAIFFCLFFVACNQQSTTQYYQKIMGIQRVLFDSIELIKADANFSPTQNSEKIQAITKRKLNELTAIEAPKSGTSLKAALVNEIEALYAYNNTLLEMTKLSENDTAIILLQDKLVRQKSILEECDNKLIVEQENFAKTHSFKIKSK